MNYTIKNADIEIYNDSESFSFPKYTSQLINWANQNAQVDIRGKMNAFCRDKNARAFILKYSVASDRSGIIFTNPEVINEIQTYL